MNIFFTYLIIGVTIGAVYALAATGLVVTYVTTGIFNFGHAAVGMVLAFIYWTVHVQLGWPTPLALAFVLLGVAPTLGLLLDVVIMRRLAETSVATKIVITVAVLEVLQGLTVAIWGTTDRNFPGLFNANQTFRVAGLVVSWNQAATLLTALLTALALRLLFRRTRIGVAMRAVVDTRELTMLNGVSPDRVTATSWALGCMLAGLAAILIAPGLNLDVGVLILLVVDAFAAAVVGRLQSLPLTVAGAMVLGIGQSLVIGYLPQSNTFVNALRPSLPFIMLFIVLLVRREERLAPKIVYTRAPTPPRLRTTVWMGAAGVALAAAASGLLSPYHLVTGSQGFVFACLLMSLVLLTGLSGQVSLTQLSFAGLGAVVMGKLDTHVPTLLAMLLAGLAAAAVGAVVALPALRLQGIYLALATLAFALMMDNMVFANSHVLGGEEALSVKPLSVAGISFAGPRAMFILLAGFVGLYGVIVLAVRRSSFGRMLTAMRDSATAVRTLGLNLVSLKLKVFALSAFLAGVAGALLGGLVSRVGPIEFSWNQSLVVFVVAMIFGISNVSGALLGAFVYVVLPHIFKGSAGSGIELVVIGIAAFALIRHPEGIGGQLAARLHPLGLRLGASRRWASIGGRSVARGPGLTTPGPGTRPGPGSALDRTEVDPTVVSGSGSPADNGTRSSSSAKSRRPVGTAR